MMTHHRAAAFAAALVALAALLAGLIWGSTVAGGADSYGYVSEAGLFLQRRLSIQNEIVPRSPWPVPLNTWTPLGYVPARDTRDTIVPLYPPGLPMVMALFQAVGGFCAAFLVVPIAGAATVWLTYALGQRLFRRPLVSLAAALLVATSPTFLYQLMNPMTDVPVTAAWTLTLLLVVRRWTGAAGIVASIAILIRPNLAPMVVVPLAWLIASGGDTRSRASVIARFVGGLLPGVVAVAALNAFLYGAPWRMGYGSATNLYALEYFPTNVAQFGRWLLETQTPIVLLATLYPLARGGALPPSAPFPGWLLGGMAVATSLSYVFYLPFGAWWFLRFLLPMWPALMLLTAVTIEGLAARVHAQAAAVAPVVVAVALGVYGVRTAAARSTFDIGRGEWRYIDIARFVAGHTDPDAVIIAVQHSGSLRMYTGRLTLRYDQLDSRWLDRAVAFLQRENRHPYIVLDGDEVEEFRRQFGEHNELGRLDWQPMAKYAGPPIVIYDVVNRSTTAEPLAIAAPSRRARWRCEAPQTWPPLSRMK